MTVHYTLVDSPLGDVMLTSDGHALTGLYFDGQKHQPAIGDGWQRDDRLALFERAASQLRAYLSGERQAFALPLAAQGTAFQRRVWQALNEIGFGHTATYAAVATRIGAPRAVRAVGAAVGRNPLSVIVPCHRVLGADRSLTGYAGGLARKRALLALEGVATTALAAEPVPDSPRSAHRRARSDGNLTSIKCE
jgi:methylated-DNA-[protein]-cysteine S-methyltransferase